MLVVDNACKSGFVLDGDRVCCALFYGFVIETDFLRGRVGRGGVNEPPPSLTLLF